MGYQFRAYVSPLLTFVGIPTNTIIIIVFYVMQLESPCRFNLYAMWLPVAQNIHLLANAFLDDFLGQGLSWITGCEVTFKVDSLSSFCCKIITFLTDVTALVKACLLMYFSADRVYCVYLPGKAAPNQKLWIARLGVVLSYTVCIIVSSPHLIYADRIKSPQGTYVCEYGNPVAPAVQYILYLYIVGATVIPFLFIIATSLCIIARMRDIIKRIPSARIDDTSAAVEFGEVVTHLTISILFSCLSIPIIVVIVLRQQVYLLGYEKTQPAYAKRIVELSKLFSSIDCINYACDFCIYVTVMSEFRKHLTRIFHLDHLCYTKSVVLPHLPVPLLVRGTHILNVTQTRAKHDLFEKNALPELW
ncbi:uncharacterized protein DEA37_0000454 [Paragonimus westermani]|uniref:G-protein coupled receptors family 1 profile domain-containing protein n=1 Tax=Paragonimus westermani TaxID=34504 RepID=A0A5J4N9D3_9TREM|nr:uncharacterized protein DEA37_0000454 [Paragonimus westermani]